MASKHPKHDAKSERWERISGELTIVVSGKYHIADALSGRMSVEGERRSTFQQAYRFCPSFGSLLKLMNHCMSFLVIRQQMKICRRGYERGNLPSGEIETDC